MAISSMKRICRQDDRPSHHRRRCSRQASAPPVRTRAATSTTYPLLLLYDHRVYNTNRKTLQILYPEPVVFQWQSRGNPVCLELTPQCTQECHWSKNCWWPVCFQWSSSGFPVVFQYVPSMQINTGSPLGHHWVLASDSVVPVAYQCTCGSSGLPVFQLCKLTLDRHWNTTGC